MVLEQNQDDDCLILEDNQPFVREVLCRQGCQASVVTFTNQTLTDISRFCTQSGSGTFPSPLLADTTFNIAEYYFTQTAYENLSLCRRDTDKHPWFPVPILVHRNKRTEDFKYFWQAVKRENPQLECLHALCTDEDEALAGGILQETTGTIHLLGLEHVRDSVERKLTDLNFPAQQRKIIQADLFGGRDMGDDGRLYDCESEEEFDLKSEAFKTKWDKIERCSTKNNPPKFTKYFERYKEKQIKEKMAKYIRDRAGVPRGFGQNPIEWLHYMSKNEIDAACGVGHRDVSLATAIQSLKNRVLRLYNDAAKALYGQGPYRLDNYYKKFYLDYDSWKDLNPEERKPVLKRFFTDVCCPIVMATTNQRNAATSRSTDKRETNGSEIPAASPSMALKEFRRFSLTTEEFDIPDEVIPSTTLRGMLVNAEALLNESGAILQAASDDPRIRTVKSRCGKVPLIVKPSKSGHQLECQCSVYKAVGLCQDTIAVAEDLSCLPTYVAQFKKKLQRKKGKGVNLAVAFNSRRTTKECGMKPYEINKANRRRKRPVVESWQPAQHPESHSNNYNTSTSCPQRSPTATIRMPMAFNNPQQTTTVPPQQQQPWPGTTSYNASPQFPQNVFPESMTTVLQQMSYSHVSQRDPQLRQQQQQQPGPPCSTEHVQRQQSYLVPSLQRSLLQQTQQDVTDVPREQRQCLAASVVPSQQHASGTTSPFWHSGLSPYQYEICLLPNMAKKCYGCNQEFAEKYRKEPFNVVIRHTDRRIKGIGPDKTIQYSTDFTNTYYHCDANHIARKNPLFDGNLYLDAKLSLTPEQQMVILNGGFRVTLK
jgi:hypothetical protein